MDLDVGLTTLILVATFPCSGETAERVLHKRFRAYRIRGEWFKWSKTIQKFVLNTTEVVVPNYGMKLKWTPICVDCLQPVWPDSLQCPGCRSLKNRGGIKKPLPPRPPQPPVVVDMGQERFNRMYDSAVVPWRRFQSGLRAEVLGSWGGMRQVTAEDFCPDCHGWKSPTAERCGGCAGRWRIGRRLREEHEQVMLKRAEKEL